MADDKARQSRRDAAVARPELRTAPGEFFFDAADKMPDDDRRVMVRAEDDGGKYSIPFAVHRKDGKWINTRTGLSLDVKIVAWRFN